MTGFQRWSDVVDLEFCQPAAVLPLVVVGSVRWRWCWWLALLHTALVWGEATCQFGLGHSFNFVQVFCTMFYSTYAIHTHSCHELDNYMLIINTNKNNLTWEKKTIIFKRLCIPSSSYIIRSLLHIHYDFWKRI